MVVPATAATLVKVLGAFTPAPGAEGIVLVYESCNTTRGRAWAELLNPKNPTNRVKPAIDKQGFTPPEIDKLC